MDKLSTMHLPDPGAQLRLHNAVTSATEAILRSAPESLLQNVCNALSAAKFRCVLTVSVNADRTAEIDAFSGTSEIISYLSGVDKQVCLDCVSSLGTWPKLVVATSANQVISIGSELVRRAPAGFLSAFPIRRTGKLASALVLLWDDTIAPSSDALSQLERLTENIEYAFDITERNREQQERQAQTLYLATHDALTGLPNNLLFSQQLAAMIECSRLKDESFAVSFLDLDKFKNVNDTYGHDAGDRLLKEVAQRLVAAKGANDIVARRSGDEFVALIIESHKGLVAATAKRFQSALVQPTHISGNDLRITTSIGISIYPTDGQDVETLMRNADAAMYKAKEEGKNNYQFYTPDIRVQPTEDLLVAAKLRDALKQQEFSVYYQPMVNSLTEKITGVEATLRWANPELGLIPPAHFIPIAEEIGLIVEIGRWALDTACRRAVSWLDSCSVPIAVAINLSAREFYEPQFVTELSETLNRTGIEASLLQFEVTEGTLLHDAALALRTLEAMKKIGVRAVLDDFGTGYTSLGYLKRFPIHALKIDRSFIYGLLEDEDDKSIVRSCISLAHQLSLKAIAEGVETKEQAEFLKRHGCDEMQGYYFGRPMPARELAQHIA